MQPLFDVEIWFFYISYSDYHLPVVIGLQLIERELGNAMIAFQNDDIFVRFLDFPKIYDETPQPEQTKGHFPFLFFTFIQCIFDFEGSPNQRKTTTVDEFGRELKHQLNHAEQQWLGGCE